MIDMKTFQWQCFSADFIKECGFDDNFYPLPIDRPELGEVVEGYDWEYTREDTCYVVCRGIGRHHDGIRNTPFSSFLILRNDGFIAKPYHVRQDSLEPQLPGTILIMNIERYHHCIVDKRIQAKGIDVGYWIAVEFAYSKRPTYEEAKTRFTDFLNYKSDRRRRNDYERSLHQVV